MSGGKDGQITHFIVIVDFIGSIHSCEMYKFFLVFTEEGLWKLQKGAMTMFLGEVVGTGVLIFIGCMGGIGTLGRTPPPPMQSAFTFGLTVNMIIMVS